MNDRSRDDREIRRERDGIDAELRERTVHDGDRALNFVGAELAFATTWKSRNGRPRPFDDLRWTEMTVYRTEAGTYILSTIGRSDVYHRLANHGGCPYGVYAKAHELHDDRWPCPVCLPDDLPDLAPDALVAVEVDRHSAVRAYTAEQLVAASHSVDRHTGVEFLSTLAQRALTAAGRQDPAVAEAYFSERVA
ncbi:MAG: hypothetical protein ACOC9R_01355 [bacterium]